jgi:beta-glucosidase
VRWLDGFAPVRGPAGETARVRLSVPTRLLAYWADGWQYEPGGYRLRAGPSAVDRPAATQVELT